MGHVIAHFLPENAIVSDEGATAGMGFNMIAGNAKPHGHLSPRRWRRNVHVAGVVDEGA
jgi:hypothetical protein